MPEQDADDAAGLSFTEFTYQLLQAYDFHLLQQKEGCTVQVGGSDQYGNIMAGVELILRMRSQGLHQPDEATNALPAYGMTVPLLTTSDGSKFGKSAGNAIWLDPTLTTNLALHTHLVRSGDQEVEQYLRTLTLLPPSEIQSLMKRHEANRGNQEAQNVLAAQVLSQLRGEETVQRTKRQEHILFKTRLEDMDPEEIVEVFKDDPRLWRTSTEEWASLSVARMAHNHGLTKSGGKSKIAARNPPKETKPN